MNIYLVRLKKNAEFVGLFVSPNDEMLCEFVDECCDPCECELLRMPPGGVFRCDAGAPPVPTTIEYPVDDRDIPDWLAGATISELWQDIFYSQQRSPKWLPLERTD